MSPVVTNAGRCFVAWSRGICQNPLAQSRTLNIWAYDSPTESRTLNIWAYDSPTESRTLNIWAYDSPTESRTLNIWAYDSPTESRTLNIWAYDSPTESRTSSKRGQQQTGKCHHVSSQWPQESVIQRNPVEWYPLQAFIVLEKSIRS